MSKKSERSRDVGSPFEGGFYAVSPLKMWNGLGFPTCKCQCLSGVERKFQPLI